MGKGYTNFISYGSAYHSIFVLNYKKLNLMLVDKIAITLGTDLGVYRKIYLVLVSLGYGIYSVFVGDNRFVGLLIPHFARMIF